MINKTAKTKLPQQQQEQQQRGKEQYHNYCNISPNPGEVMLQDHQRLQQQQQQPTAGRGNLVPGGTGDLDPLYQNLASCRETFAKCVQLDTQGIFQV